MRLALENTFHRICYRVVVVCLILDQWVIPAIANQDTHKRNVMCSLNVFGILRLKIFVVYWSIMPPVAFCREIETVSGILWESAHKALQGFPEVRCSLRCRRGRQGFVGIRICAAAPVSRIIRTCVVLQLHNVTRCRIDVPWDGNRVGEPNLRRLIDEEHVADLTP